MQTIDDDFNSPTFLVGFPRSGTSLTERVISSHSEVTNSDEEGLIHLLLNKLGNLTGNRLGYPYSLNDLSVGQITVLRKEYWELARDLCNADPGKMFLDKLPLNIIELCFINRIFPDARILLVLRDPRDVCLSCFMQLFKANDAMANYYDLESTARFYNATMGLWYHYEEVLDLNLYKLNYEKLISDFENQVRMLFVFLGLEWEEGVLEYYKNSKYSISTPSYTDTSKPIYSNAVGRWQHYQYHMQPVMGLLNSHIVGFGYDTKS